MTALIGLLFFLSGAIGLGYEIVWIKILTLHFGNSAWSVSAVVGAFMLGLGLGSWQAERLSFFSRRPLRVYAYLEIGIALFGLVSIPVFENIDHLLGAVYHVLENHFIVFILFRLVVAFAVLIIPTFLMGASLPVLVKFFLRMKGITQTVGFLYGINTLGAAVGTFLTGFFLLPALGARSSLLVLAAIGVLIGMAAIALSNNLNDGASHEETIASRHRSVPWAIYMAAFCGGFIGIFYEVGWTRLFVPIIGSSTYAFSIILLTFLIGIGLGGLLVTRNPFVVAANAGLAGALIVTTSLLAVCGIFIVNYLPAAFISMAVFFHGNIALFFGAQIILTGLLMFLPTLLLGATLPLCMSGVEGSVGRVYAANTAGSILGSLAAGFIFLPMLGVRLSILLMSAAVLIVGLLLVWFDRVLSQRIKQAIVLWGVALGAVLFLFRPTIDMAHLQRGFFRRILKQPPVTDNTKPYQLFLRDGITSTVSVYRTADVTWLNVNGKTDASTTVDNYSQFLIAHLPLMFNPKAKAVCIIGYGSGATVNAAAGYPVEKIDVVELEPAVLQTSPYFERLNDNILSDPRVRVHLEDGRTFLKYRQEQYDTIISEPSNPWIAGVASLFTREFYRDSKKRLSPGGVFCQWIQQYEVSDETRNVMLNTLADEFKYVHLFHQSGDLVVVASDQPMRTDPSLVDNLFKRSGVKKTLEQLNIHDKYALFIGYLGSFPEDRSMYHADPRNTDDNHWLEFRAPIEMYSGAEPVLHPLPSDILLNRYRTVFYSGISSETVSIGLAQAVYTLRPYASGRIDSMKAFVTSDSGRRQMKELYGAAIAKSDRDARRPAALETAGSLVMVGKYDEALNILKEFATSDNRESIVFRIQGDAYFNLRKLNEARQSLRRALELNPNDYSAGVTYGVLHFLSNQNNEGEQLLLRAIQLNPYYVPARSNLAIHYVLTKQMEKLSTLTIDSKRVLSRNQFAEYTGVLQGNLR